jgi:hypothetical protein
MNRQTARDHLPILRWVLTGLLILSGLACTTEERFLDLDNNLAGPVDVVHAGSYFYILNSDFDRRYNQGSILVLDPDAPDGEKKKAVIPTRRMGRSLHAVGSWLLVTYDADEFEEQAHVELRRLSDDGLSVPVVQQWTIECSPVKGQISPREQYLVVSCLGGDIWAGRLNTDNPGASSLQHVRSYGFTRRALYIYETAERSVLMAFPTDLADPNLADLSAQDAWSYEPTEDDNKVKDDGTLELAEGANEVPDVYEETLSDIRQLDLRQPYQMILYDLAAAEDAGFPLVENGTFTSPTQADLERKFIYFTLKNVDGIWEVSDQWLEGQRKYYRTNFWAAQPDPGRTDTFYVSQRGYRDSPYANNIVRVRLNEAALPADFSELGSITTASLFNFERVYGFAGENLDGKNYPGDFAVTSLEGQDVLLVNHFRDAVYWDPLLQKFSIAFKKLGTLPTEQPPDEIIGGSFDRSFYELAVNEQGTVVSCAFYGDAVLILQVDPDTGIDSNITVVK